MKMEWNNECENEKQKNNDHTTMQYIRNNGNSHVDASDEQQYHIDSV